jgi:hypothetical protein
MPAVSFPVLQAAKNTNIRRGGDGAILLGKYGVAPIVTTLVGTGGTITVADTYESVGHTSEEGLNFSKDRSMVEVRGWAGTVLRRDIKSEDHTFSFTALETKRLTYELKNNQSYTGSNAEFSAAGEWKNQILIKPDILYWRVIGLTYDGSGSDLYYMAKVYHRCMVSEMDDEAWSNGDEPLQYNVTMAAEPDDVAGTLGTEFIFGPGALAAATRMGFTVAT